MQVWLAPVPIQSSVGAIANRGQWEQGCCLYMATDLGPVRATRKKKTFPQFRGYSVGLTNLAQPVQPKHAIARHWQRKKWES